MARKRRFIFLVLGLIVVLILVLVLWIQWGRWPDPAQEVIFKNADVILILGGEDVGRAEEGTRLAARLPNVPVVVTGDGGEIFRILIENEIPKNRIAHEDEATSTAENAKFTQPILERLGAKKVILVTSWFHAPRSLATFRKVQPQREFIVSFSPKPATLMSWDKDAQRRERMAAIWYFICDGIWSW